MRESTLRDFFIGNVSGAVLAEEAAASIEVLSSQSRRVHVERDLDEAFFITRAMLIKLCDAVEAGGLPAPLLETIAFAILASDQLEWDFDDDLDGRVLYDWAAPEINWELTPESVVMFRGWLTGTSQPPPVPQLPVNLSIHDTRYKEPIDEHNVTLFRPL